METPGAATTETTQAEPDGNAADTPGAESATAADDTGKQKTKPGQELDSRVDELTANWRNEQRNTEHYRSRTQELERELDQMRSAANDRKTTETDSTDDDADLKTLADFDFNERKYGKYIRDEARKAARQESEALRTEITENRSKAARDAALDDFQGKSETWAKEQKIDDVEKMFAQPKDGGPNVTPIMAEAIMDSEHGPAMLHYLLKNRAEAVKICRMSPVQQAREIGRLEATVAKAQTRTVSQAPAPAPHIDGSSASVGNTKPDSAESDKMSDAEWTRARNKQLAGQKLAASNRR